jgi:hypothetical protein
VRTGHGTLVVTSSADDETLSNEASRAPAVAAVDTPDEYGPDGVRITRAPDIREVSALDPPRTRLPAPHRRPAGGAASAPSTRPGAPPPTRPAFAPPSLRSTHELRLLVGRRDARDPVAVALAWARQLGVAIEGGLDGATIADVTAWAERRNRLADRSAPPMPGDLLVFARTQSDADLDLVGVVIDRDARGVTELVYLAGGVVRRGFVDAARPTLRRDDKLRVVNTFLRHGRRWPPPGTRYLSGELLAHVIRTR